MALAETIQLYAAGSLREALTDVAKAYQAKTGNTVVAKYGPSGTLMNDASPAAKAFAQFIMFPESQRIFLGYGFSTVK